MIAGQQTIDATTVKQLRHQIASVISEQKAYNVPSVCCRYGLDDGTGEEAFQSKYKYVMRRVDRLPSDDILRIAAPSNRTSQVWILGRFSRNLMRK